MADERTSEGGGSEFQRVSDALHSRLADGTYPLDSLLPTQRELAREFDVSRDTIQRVMKELGSEGLIRSKQGSGSRVVKAQLARSSSRRQRSRSGRVSLGPVIGAAFEAPQVTLDVFTLTSESLDAHIHRQAERIHVREIAPERITVRILLPSEDIELPYPRAKDDPADSRPQQRLREITRRHTASLRNALRDLHTVGLVPDVSVEVRRVPLVPTFKLYLLNGAEALHGPYEVIERRIHLDDGEVVEALDVLGMGSVLTQYVRDDGPESQGAVFVDSMQNWFNSCWDLLAKP
ncbi:GntR family transcriptional regulator [Streptomyces durmitorensis]|uniref:Winged helix-turn-helix domain-containing protein n=1 Tax=Streptomyces durmitorensis TaxID=319947 RepID=A0ABY4PX89_9ACTN|nr:winged helix-turn-helix domain-containing protein [Streptomyces durmitorensis]UQT57745.1 winged helix-turn-helix domain-containing protein [Streptomyces durmitorensis]